MSLYFTIVSMKWSREDVDDGDGGDDEEVRLSVQLVNVHCLAALAFPLLTDIHTIHSSLSNACDGHY